LQIQNKHKVTYESFTMTGFVVCKPDGTNYMFKPSEKGLIFSDVKQDIAHVLVNTVNSIKIITP